MRELSSEHPGEHASPRQVALIAWKDVPFSERIHSLRLYVRLCAVYIYQRL
jgi:hypothetical protein